MPRNELFLQIQQNLKKDNALRMGTVSKKVLQAALLVILIFQAKAIWAQQSNTTSTPTPVPTPTSTPLAGNVTGAGNQFMEVEMQTYKAMQRVTDRIACEVKATAKHAKVIVLYKPADYALWRNYKLLQPTLTTQLESMKTEYEAWLNSTSATPASLSLVGVIPAVTTAVRSFIDLAAFFRSDIEITPKEVQIDENALRGGMTHSLRWVAFDSSGNCASGDFNPNLKIYDPSMFYPSNSATGDLDAPILTTLEELAKLRSRAEAEISKLEIETAELEQKRSKAKLAAEKVAALNAIIKNNPEILTKLNKQISETKDQDEKKALRAARNSVLTELNQANQNLPQAVSDAQTAQQDFEAANTAFDSTKKLKIVRLKQLNSDLGKLLADFTKADPTTGLSPLMMYVRAENLDSVLRKQNKRDLNLNEVYWLQIKSIRAGGSNRVTKNLIRYFYKPDISYSGGSIIEFALSDKNGDMILSNTKGGYEKYRKASKISADQ